MGPTSPVTPRPALRGDEEHLFRTHHRRLLRLVARDVSARPHVIEDACAYAWLELVARQPARTNIIGWLRVVARREAIRLAQYDRRLATFTPGDHDRRAAHGSRSLLEAREALGLVAAVAPRRRAVLVLQVSRHSHR